MTSSQPPNRPRWQPGTVLAIWATFAALGLHIYFLVHAGALWRDEVNVVNLAGSNSLAWMTRDSFPVLMPLLIKVWRSLGLGGTDLRLRLLGMLIGVCLPLALWLAARAARRPAPVLSLILLGLNSTVIFWGDSLRAFGLGSVLIVLALAALCWLVEKPGWRRAAVLAAAAVLSVQALYQNTVLFAALAAGGWLVCWLRRDRQAAMWILVAGLAAFISVLPYWGCVVKWSSATGAIRPGFSFMAAAGNFNTVAAFPLPFFASVWQLLWLAGIIGGTFTLFGAKAEGSVGGKSLTPSEARIFAGTVLLCSLVGYFCFLYFAALITEPWYFLPLFAVAAVCFDFSLPAKWPPAIARLIVTAALGTTAIIAMAFSTRDLNCRLTNIDSAAAYLGKNVAPGDYVVVTPWYLGISFARYYHGTASWDTLPPVADHSTHRFDLLPVGAADQARALQPALDRMAAALQSGHRVWVTGWMSVPAAGRRANSDEARYLAEHSLSFKEVGLNLWGATSDFEEVRLLQASGWRTNGP